MCVDVGKNVPLAPFSTIGIGGTARELAIVNDESQLASLLCEHAIVIGKGSNILFSDSCISQRVLILRNSFVKIPKLNDDKKLAVVEVGAGTSLSQLVGHLTRAGLGGLEWACGIPSSVGGAVYMNAGAHGGCILDVLHSVRVLKAGKIVELKATECGLAYRKSAFMQSNDIILSARFVLRKESKDQIQRKTQEYLQSRKKTQPSGRSLGSVFKNADKPAGFYIDSAGLKGSRVGGLIVSEKHANFIINQGGGTAKDFLTLVSIIKSRVYDKFGVDLKEEFIKIGSF